MMPATRPARLAVRSLLEVFRSMARTVVMADTTLSFFCSPKATTATSSRFSEVERNSMLMLFFPSTGTISVL